MPAHMMWKGVTLVDLQLTELMKLYNIYKDPSKYDKHKVSWDKLSKMVDIQIN